MTSFRIAFLCYFLVLFALFLPFFSGDVVAPHRQASELGLMQQDSRHSAQENRKFSDYTDAFVPEIQEHFSAPRSGWVSLWTDRSELGRPLYHTAGFSPAYLPSMVLFQSTDDPRLLITILSLSYTVLAGVFIILFAREVGLTPMAGWTAGISLAAAPVSMYWLTFPMFSAGWCWAAGVLYAITCLDKKPSLIIWSLLAFFCYSLLMTAYPQPVVFHIYIFVIYALFLAYRKVTWQQSVVFLMQLMLAVAIASILAGPVYLDLLRAAADSARVTPDIAFFIDVLPRFSGLNDILQFIALSTVPELFGNPISSGFPFPYNGLSLTPLALFFVVICFFAALWKTWAWWLAAGVILLLALVHPLYAFGVQYLGFNLSRSTPIGMLILPVTIILAFGIDAVSRAPSEVKNQTRAMIAAAFCLLSVVVGVIVGITSGVELRWKAVLVYLIFIGLLYLYAVKGKSGFLFAAVMISLAGQSYPLMLRQDPAQIVTTSALVQMVKDTLPEGARIAIVSPDIRVLPPNMTAGLGISSIHSYNSLSSRKYHSLIERIGGDVQTFGRRNSAVSPDYSSYDFWMNNIGVVLSSVKIVHPNLELVGIEAGLYLHTVKSRMNGSLQVLEGLETLAPGVVEIGDFMAMRNALPAKKTLNEGDIVEFQLSTDAPSTLVLSQKFHSDWKAFARRGENWEPIDTVVVNGVYQGIEVPDGVDYVRLSFRPLSRFGWVSNVFWGSLMIFLVFRNCFNRHSVRLEKQ